MLKNCISELPFSFLVDLVGKATIISIVKGELHGANVKIGLSIKLNRHKKN
jgi:hypothetical protein